jgi:uncharacterized membrane protein YgcG
VPTGEAFTEGQLQEIARAVATANAETGLHFSVFVGEPEGPHRAYAERLHAALGPHARRAVLVLVAPGQRVLEIVTGEDAARRVPDRACGLAALSMRTSFVGGDLTGGIVTGLRMMSEAAGRVAEVTRSGDVAAATER